MATPPCCPPEALPALENVHGIPSPKGKTIKIHSPQQTQKFFRPTMNVYMTGQMDLMKSKRIVVIFPDVWGYNSGRHCQLADTLVQQIEATTSYPNSDNETSCQTTILIPDYYRGNIIAYYQPCLGEKMSIVTSVPVTLYRLRYCDYIFENLYEIFLPWLESQIGNPTTKYELSCIGICFGGWVVGKILGKFKISHSNPKVDWKCGIGIHPSFMVESFYRLGESEEALAQSMIQNQKIPFFAIPAGDDSEKFKMGGSVTQILAEGYGVEEEEVVMVMENMKHGFITRGDGSADEEIKEAQRKTEEKVAEFICQHHPIE